MLNFELIEQTYCSLISVQIGEEEDECSAMPAQVFHSNQGLAQACKFVHNDAKFVNERARNDIILLSRYYTLFSSDCN